MKLNGERPGVHIEPIVLPRPKGDLVFHAKAVGDYEEFDNLCPVPEPPKRKMADGSTVSNVTDEGYRAQVAQYSQKRVAYMCIKGLAEGTPHLEWEDVKLEDHTTWLKFEDELRDSGLSDIEIKRVVAGCMKANCLNEKLIEEARKRFLAGEQAQNE